MLSVEGGALSVTLLNVSCRLSRLVPDVVTFAFTVALVTFTVTFVPLSDDVPIWKVNGPLIVSGGAGIPARGGVGEPSASTAVNPVGIITAVDGGAAMFDVPLATRF